MITIISNLNPIGYARLNNDPEYRFVSDPSLFESYALLNENSNLTGLLLVIKDWASKNIFAKGKNSVLNLRLKEETPEIFRDCIYSIEKFHLYKENTGISTVINSSSMKALEYLKNSGFKIFDKSIYMKLIFENSDFPVNDSLEFKHDFIIDDIDEINEFYRSLMAIYEGSRDKQVLTVKKFLKTASDDDKKTFFTTGFSRFSLYYIYNKNNEKIGLLQFDKNIGYLANVGFFKNFRGKGYGKIAVNFAHNSFMENNIKISTLRVYANNKNAIKLYEKIGYVIDKDVIGLMK